MLFLVLKSTFWKVIFTMDNLEAFTLVSAGKKRMYYSMAVVWNKVMARSLKKCEIMQKKRLRINSAAKVLSHIFI